MILPGTAQRSSVQMARYFPKTNCKRWVPSKLASSLPSKRNSLCSRPKPRLSLRRLILSNRALQMPPDQSTLDALDSGQRPFDIAFARRNFSLGDYDLLLNRISEEDWLKTQTTVGQGDYASEELPKERRLASAMMLYEDLANNRDNIKYGAERLPFAGAAIQFYDLKQVRQAAERFANDEANTSDFQTLAQFLQAAKANEKLGTVQQILDIVSYLPGFALEFMATAGVGSAASAGIRGGAVKAMGGLAEAGAKRAIQKGAIKATGAIASGAVRGAMMPQRIAAKTEEYRLYEGEDEGKAVARGYVNTVLEVLGEMSGEAIVGASGKLLRKSKPIASALDKISSMTKPGTALHAVANAFKKAGIQNPPVEYLEEVLTAESAEVHQRSWF